MSNAVPAPVIVDSIVVSSHVVTDDAPHVREHGQTAPLNGFVTLAPTLTPAETRNPRALAPTYSPERVRKMYETRLPVPSSAWDGLKWVTFTAFFNSLFVVSVNTLRANAIYKPACVMYQKLAGGTIEITVTRAQLLDIIACAYSLRRADGLNT